MKTENQEVQNVVENVEDQVVQETPAQTETAMEVQNETAVVEVQKSPLEKLAEKKLAELQELNPDFKLDFMNVFTRLKVNSKGQFVYTLSGEEFKLSDSIDVRLIVGEYMYQYWGEKDSENEGELICYSKDHATNCDGGKCSECPYDPDKCKIRFALVLHVLEDGEDVEELFNINIPSTATFAFADYVKLLKKKFKKGVHEVVTKMFTEEKIGTSDSTIKYNAILFKFSENQNKLG